MEVCSLTELERDSFTSLDEIKDYCLDLSRALGFAIVIARSRTKAHNRKTVYFACVFGGQYKSQGRGIRQTSSCKKNCPFKLIARERKEDFWTLEIKNGSHNHELNNDASRLVPHRKLTEEQQIYAVELMKKGVRPRGIVKIFKDENLPQINAKDVHNMVRRRMAIAKRQEESSSSSSQQQQNIPVNSHEETPSNNQLDSDQISLLQRAVQEGGGNQLTDREIAEVRMIIQQYQQ